MRTRTTVAAAAVLAAGALPGWLMIPGVGQEKQRAPGAKIDSPFTPTQLAERTLQSRR
jgi:hypothetical protein